MISKTFCVLLVLSAMALFDSSASAGIAELFNDIEDPMLPMNHPSIISNSLQDVLEEDGVGTPCHMEYQVTKKKVGRCTKLGHGVRGCVSGTYLNPFHPDCM
ncbi:uncharacterized protein LOC107265886 [Cephus cinctus]|uniref:Uncharacterized protein LOC107265886 n=1 Tax=Cephus cinctus TaxID=211228 RepID=A0AAJ7BPP6_CEPCN|nr:uncharacterized protein LOC107265886 [Cephus cinctus]